MTAGSEGIGIVEAIGSGVAGIKIGQRYSASWLGTWAEQLMLPAFMLMPVPDSVSDQIACQIRSNPITAYALLQEIKGRGYIINNAADTSVGRLIIQIAARRHQPLINLTRFHQDVPGLKNIEAKNIVATEDKDWVQQVKRKAGSNPIVGVLDAVSGNLVAQLLGILAPGAQIINYGRLSGHPLNLTEAQAKAVNLNLEFFVIGEWMHKVGPEKRQQVFNELWDLFAKKALVIPVAGIYPLTEFKKAIKLAESPDVKGKVLLSS
ncbi:MAG: zinc-binding dehydrogenase [Dehalococcoidales bacterium]|nr:zinc-binding dehydrogenase [Dehalococcoidales bacterium]